MAFNKELRFAFILAVVLFIVGVISYAAFPLKAPEQPIRIMFKSIAGNVLFDHKIHSTVSGYGISCRDCHHMLDQGSTDAQACIQCHEPNSEDPSVPKRSDAFHRQCINCHQQIEAGPKECNSCHVL